MNAELIAVGTELLMGQIANTNAQYLSAKLSALGINVHYHTTIGDNAERLLKTLEIACKRSDCIILTGGLGPTYDDMTKETVAGYFGMPLEENEAALRPILSYFEKKGLTMAPSNLKQALVPKGAHILPNDVGTAPGIFIEKNEKTVALLPGPPSEMKIMFDKYLSPILKKKSGVSVVSEYIQLFGIGESKAESSVAHLTESKNPTIATYVKGGILTFRISASGKNESDAKALIKPFKDEVYRLFKDYIYGEGMDFSLPLCAFNLLKENKLTLSIAESCTGGRVSAEITGLPGASDIFMYGAVSYANSAKIYALGVYPDTLSVHGAVSSETALEMARGVRIKGGTDIGVSTTGIAGPSGGTPDKPVGTVYIGISTPSYEDAILLNLSGSRERIQMQTVLHVYNLIRKIILENKF